MPGADLGIHRDCAPPSTSKSNATRALYHWMSDRIAPPAAGALTTMSDHVTAKPQGPRPTRASASFVSGFDRGSAVVVVVVVVVGVASGLLWRDYVSLSLNDADPLLIGCWLVMVLLAARRVRFAHDAPLALVALVGGAVIETWGTRAGLWRYFNGESPPLFILPAWPAAALATSRLEPLARHGLSRVSARALPPLALVAFAAFAVAFARWARPGAAHPLTWIAFACSVITAATARDLRADLARFAAGSALGFPLELWGTTRHCWDYYDGRCPPWVAVAAHGFATVAFARGAGFVRSLAAPAAGSTRDAETGSPSAPSASSALAAAGHREQGRASRGGRRRGGRATAGRAAKPSTARREVVEIPPRAAEFVCLIPKRLMSIHPLSSRSGRSPIRAFRRRKTQSTTSAGARGCGCLPAPGPTRTIRSSRTALWPRARDARSSLDG